MAALMHPASSKVLPDCGHWVPLEAPDAFAEVLLNSLEEASSQETSRENSDGSQLAASVDTEEESVEQSA